MSGLMAAAAIGTAVAGLGKIIGGSIGSRRRKNEQRAAQTAQNQAMRRFENFQFSNPYGNITNPAANLGDPTANFQDFTRGLVNTAEGAQNFASQMENVAEDLTVDTTAAQFLAGQQQQALADTLGGLRQAAGGSGVAALAQALAGQQSQNLQQARASIATQEQANRRLAAEQAGRIQAATAAESSANQRARIAQAAQIQELQARTRTQQQQFGAQLAQQRDITSAQLGFRAQLAQAAGEETRQQLEFDRLSTELGMAQNRLGAANEARRQATGTILGGVGDLGGALAQGFAGGFNLPGSGSPSNLNITSPSTTNFTTNFNPQSSTFGQINPSQSILSSGYVPNFTLPN